MQEPAPERFAREPGLAEVREPVQALALAQGLVREQTQGPEQEPVQAWQSAADSG